MASSRSLSILLSKSNPRIAYLGVSRGGSNLSIYRCAFLSTSNSSNNPLGEHVLTPSARHISMSQGLDGTVLYPGSGKKGRVTKGDVLAAIKNGSLPKLATAALSTSSTTSTSTSSSTSSTSTSTSTVGTPTPPPSKSSAAPVQPNLPDVANYTDIKNSSMRRVIARRLTESKATVPHFYTTYSIELDSLMKLRKIHNANLTDAKISVNDYIVKAASLALRDVPEMNSQFKSNARSLQSSVDISIAVATPNGLITPIVPKCETLSLYEINSKIKDLATRARDNKLLPHEYQGGTFTISNLGMFGIKEFSAVINPPQCAILAVGGGQPKMVKGDDHTLEPRNEMKVRLSADRRVVDEATAGLFLQCFKNYLSTPELMVL